MDSDKHSVENKEEAERTFRDIGEAYEVLSNQGWAFVVTFIVIISFIVHLFAICWIQIVFLICYICFICFISNFN